MPRRDRSAPRLLLALAVLLVSAGLAAAQPTPSDKARMIYLQAQEEFVAGRYERALDLLGQAQALDPQPRVDWSRGVILAKLGRRREAITAYERFLVHDIGSPLEDLDRARRELIALYDDLGGIVVRGNDRGAIAIDGDIESTLPTKLPLRVTPGEHHVAIARWGYRLLTKTIVTKPGEVIFLRPSQRLLDDEEPGPPPTRAAAGGDGFLARHRWSVRLGVGAAALGLTTATLVAVGVEREAPATNLVLGGTIALASSAAIAFVLERRDARRARRAMLVPSTSGVALRVTF